MSERGERRAFRLGFPALRVRMQDFGALGTLPGQEVGCGGRINE